MKDGVKEKDIMGVVSCKGFKKLLNIRDCTPEKCKYHLGIIEEPIRHRDDNGVRSIIGINKSIKCGFPRLLKVFDVCELEE